MRNVYNGHGQCLGTVNQGASGVWFANPHESQVQAIPCDSLESALATVRRLGRLQPYSTGH